MENINKSEEPKEETDINDIFENILLTEEKLVEQGYSEGFQNGIKNGNLEGFHLGYHRGAEIGAEIGFYYGVTKVLEDTEQNDKVKKNIDQLKKLIESFPHNNTDAIDFLQLATDIRAQYKKVCAIVKLKLPFPETDNLSF